MSAYVGPPKKSPVLSGPVGDEQARKRTGTRCQGSVAWKVVRAPARDAATRLARWSQRVDKKEVRLTILASAILVGVPLIVNAIHDLLSGRWDEHLGRRPQSDPADVGEAALDLRGRPVEQLAADLRRLRVAVATDQRRSATHQLANRVAYDQLLMQACQMLNVPHELGKNTAGPERDIERIRVEAELERAGIVLSSAGRSG
jgi:hypothetical protein